MMKYRQNNSTFIPKEKSALNFNTSNENNSPNSSTEKLVLQIKEYNNKIKELEKQLKFKDTEIRSFNNLVESLKGEIERLKDTPDPMKTTKTDSLNVKLDDIKAENARLKKEIAIQNEHTELLYILIIILAIM